jgi:hypothetical protein
MVSRPAFAAGAKAPTAAIAMQRERLWPAHWNAAREITWTTLGPGDQLDTPYGAWDLDAIYDQVDADATI